MKGVILCGGLGKEMSPLSSLVPKASLIVQGKPIFQHVINGLNSAGIKDIIVVVGSNGEPIIRYLRNNDSDSHFIVINQKMEGVVGAILSAREEIKESRFLLAHGDIIASGGFYQHLVKTYERMGADGGIAVTLKSSIEDFGVTLFDDNGQITQVIEHPAKGKTDIGNYIGSGAYIFPVEFFDALSIANTSFDSAINYLIRKKYRLVASVFSEEGLWMDIGNPFDLLTANRILFSQYMETKISTSAHISSDAHVEGPVIIESGAIIDHGAVIKGPVYIGRNTYIGTNCLIRDHTAIEEGCVIGFSVEITRSHIQPETKVGRLSFIGDSIIGRKVEIRSGVTVVNELPTDTVLDVRGSVFQKAGIITGDQADIGANTVLEPLTVINSKEKTPPGIVIADRQHQGLKTRLKKQSEK